MRVYLIAAVLSVLVVAGEAQSETFSCIDESLRDERSRSDPTFRLPPLTSRQRMRGSRNFWFYDGEFAFTVAGLTTMQRGIRAVARNGTAIVYADRSGRHRWTVTPVGGVQVSIEGTGTPGALQGFACSWPNYKEPAATSRTPSGPATLPTTIAEQWAGPARSELQAFARQQKGYMDVPFQSTFYGDFNGDGQEDAVVFVYTNIEGAAGNFDLKVVLFRGEGGRYRFLRDAPNVFGVEPRNARFAKGRVEITTTMPRPGDPRCCPTGSKTFAIRTD